MIVEKGDVIVSTVRTYLRAITKIKQSHRYICSTGFCVISGKEILKDFLYYFCLGEYFIQSIVSQSVGVSYPAINSSEIKNLMILLPCYEEQLKTIKALDQQTMKIDTLITDIEAQIECLKEYRQSLISEAVTGKINVCEETY